MEFVAELAAIQQQLARCQDMVARRVAVLEALDAGRGERVLEVGCGSGLYLREIAVAVGVGGSAVGVDLSEDQVDAARACCNGLGQVRVEVGDLLSVPAADRGFDAAVAVQALEYVTNVEAAVAELARVLRRGGRLINVATNWGALFWSGGNQALTERVLSVWEHHSPHPNLPATLVPILHAAGFSGIRQTPLTIINRRFHPNTFSWAAARLMATFARSNDAITDADIDAWLQSLDDADAAGTHFLSSVPVLTTATLLG